MATYDEIFAGYEPPKTNNYAMKRYFDKVFVGYEPPKKDDEERSLLETAFYSTPLGRFVDFLDTPATHYLGGTVAEIAGNALQTLGDPDRTLAARYNPSIGNALRDAGDFAQNLADTALENGQSRIEVSDNDTYSGSFGNAFESDAYGVFGGLASMLHADKDANAFNQTVQELADQNAIDPEFSWEYLTNPHGLTRSFGQTAGSMAAIAPTMLAMPEATAARGVTALGGSAIEQALIRHGLPTRQKFSLKVHHYAKYLSDKQYEKLRDNKFVKQDTLKIHDTQDENGRHLVTWTEYANSERDYIIDGSARGRFLMDDAIQILDEQQLEDGTYKVTVREGIPALTNRKGYIPHFFHEYHVAIRNADGKQIGDIIGTGRTQREAIKLAEQWQKNHTLKDGENIHITPRTFNASARGMSEKNTPIMGDKDFEVMLSRIAKNTGTTLAEAKEIVNSAVKLKNRHRFLGQLLQRNTRRIIFTT